MRIQIVYGNNYMSHKGLYARSTYGQTNSVCKNTTLVTAILDSPNFTFCELVLVYVH